jgi:hypothetical protein
MAKEKAEKPKKEKVEKVSADAGSSYFCDMPPATKIPVSLLHSSPHIAG